ncbi:histone-fold-containing protein [Westerdykella ornata]|uniref:NCT transcriptional regulatory complex subunit A n=1 Tax=Westerdykella ornata TaxID=318751 RepID=A0A6A6JNC4_WESOR|nr:histone-fold-containing protein [Westerdykella ornata]KAF2278017.1 histone-fold-containing protein [Westerdykella ornata]
MPRTVKQEQGRYDSDYLPEPSDTAIGKRPEGNGAGDLAGSAPASGNQPKEIVIKNHFPVARIKRIMQADDDVGKVAQVTPVVVSKALELFMISLVTKAAAEARSRNSKRVAPLHLKQVVTTNEQFDFLSEIVAKVADAPAPAEKSGDAMDVDSKKRKGPGKRRKKADEDDF